MIIYRDANNKPTYVAWVVASNYRDVRNWLQDHPGYTLSDDLVKTEREYISDVAKYVHVDLPYWNVWHLCELIEENINGA